MSIWSSIWNGVKGVLGFGGGAAVSSASALVSNAQQMKYQKELMSDQYGYNVKLADKNLAQSKALQQFQNDYTTKMASSAHQIEVDDMRKAGLNPILSATGGNGASFSTGGATISSGSSSAGQAPDVDYLSSALALRQQKNQNKQTDSIVDLQGDQASNVRMQTKGQAWRNLQDQYTYDVLQPLQSDLIKEQINATAAQTRNYDANSTAALINAAANKESASAQAYYNRHRALGFSSSSSESSHDSYNNGGMSAFGFHWLPSKARSTGFTRSSSYTK